jgi:hypothetical protein
MLAAGLDHARTYGGGVTAAKIGDAEILKGRELHVQMLDCDASFLSGEAPSCMT